MDTIPIVKMGDVLMVTIKTDLQDRVAVSLMKHIPVLIVEYAAKGVLIDISTVQIIDTYIGRTLTDLGMIAGVLDAEVIVIGMQPAVALTLVALGLGLPGERTALDAEHGITMINRRLWKSGAVKAPCATGVTRSI